MDAHDKRMIAMLKSLIANIEAGNVTIIKSESESSEHSDNDVAAIKLYLKGKPEML